MTCVEMESCITNYFSSYCDAERQIGESDVSNKQLIGRLVENCKNIRDKLSSKLTIQSVVADELAGDGYTSSIYRIVITFTDDSRLSVVMKVLSAQKVDVLFDTFTATLEVKDRALAVDAMLRAFASIHNRECDVYGVFAGSHILPLPHIYDIQRIDLATSVNENGQGDEKRCGMIIMEDLTTTAKIVDVCDGLKAAHIRNIVHHFAKLHAHLLSSEKSAAWRDLNGDWPFKEDSGQYGDKMVDVLIGIEPESFEVPVKRLRKTIVTTQFRDYCQRGCCSELDIPELLVHGDLWSNNLLWKTAEDNTISSELSGVIDWQMSFKGNFMIDFARLFISSMDFAARKELEAWIFEYYFDQLKCFLADRGVDEVAFSLESLRKAYEFGKVGQCSMVIAVVPLLQKTYAARFDASEAARRVEIVTARARALAGEAVEVLEELAPQWLSP